MYSVESVLWSFGLQYTQFKIGMFSKKVCLSILFTILKYPNNIHLGGAIQISVSYTTTHTKLIF